MLLQRHGWKLWHAHLNHDGKQSVNGTDQWRGGLALRVSPGARVLSSIFALTLLLASCSERTETSTAGSPFGAGELSQRQFSPGAAEALSVVASGSERATDPFAAAVECAAALQVTLKAISRVPQVSSNEIAALQQAEVVFREDANRLTGDTPAPQAIAAKVREVEGSPAAQVRLAIACLRQSPVAS
jgi:hypothetical protein